MLFLLAPLVFAGASITAVTAKNFDGTLNAQYTAVATFSVVNTNKETQNYQIACKTSGCMVQRIVSRGSFDNVTPITKVTRAKDGTFTFSLTPKDALPSDILWTPPEAITLPYWEW